MVRIIDGHRVVEAETLIDAFRDMWRRASVKGLGEMEDADAEILKLLDQGATVGWLVHQTGRAEVSVQRSLSALDAEDLVYLLDGFWFRTQAGHWSVEDYDNAA